jgi:hypothetical protein
MANRFVSTSDTLEERDFRGNLAVRWPENSPLCAQHLIQILSRNHIIEEAISIFWLPFRVEKVNPGCHKEGRSVTSVFPVFRLNLNLKLPRLTGYLFHCASSHDRDSGPSVYFLKLIVDDAGKTFVAFIGGLARKNGSLSPEGILSFNNSRGDPHLRQLKCGGNPGNATTDNQDVTISHTSPPCHLAAAKRPFLRAHQ